MPADKGKAADGGVNYTPILRHLTYAYAAGITAELALKQQSADRDEQIAEVLRLGVVWHVSEAVIEIEKLAGIRHR